VPLHLTMGINTNAVRFLLFARELGVSFERALTVGRQNLFVHVDDLCKVFHEFSLPMTEDEARDVHLTAGGFVESLLRRLGAEIVESTDASSYEGASILHDMNLPVEPHLHQRFTAVIDSGTLEHVFNFPQAIRNCMEMLSLGGHYLAITPANNFLGHGFYQFSPELYFRVFSQENGFDSPRVFIYEDVAPFRWFEVRDPEAARSRVELRNYRETYLMVIARRAKIVNLFERFPQQSDYVTAWDSQDKSRVNNILLEPRSLWRRNVPAWIKSALQPIRQGLKEVPMILQSRRFPKSGTNHFGRLYTGSNLIDHLRPHR
jgi:hypothetical protein